MAVYTHLSNEQIAQHLARYNIGELVSARGITEGIENTNYLVETRQNTFILTLFEKRVNTADLPYFVAAMEWFAKAGIHCPNVLISTKGESILELAGRSAIIVSFLQGAGVETPVAPHFPLLGEAVAKMHVAAQGFNLHRPNSMGLDAWHTLAKSLDGRADDVQPGLTHTIENELAFLQKNWPSNVPSGLIHADLFPDNVFFQGAGDALTLSGIIDFYFACSDAFAYDLAIVINAWCFDETRHPERSVSEVEVSQASSRNPSHSPGMTDYILNEKHMNLLLTAYQKIRPLSDQEKAALPILLRGAALRFLLTRCIDSLNQVQGADVRVKDPMEYVAKLTFFQSSRILEEVGISN